MSTTSSVRPAPASPSFPRQTWLAARRHPVLGIVLTLLSLLAVVATLRLSIYMFEPARTDFSLIPGEAFLTHHSCLSSYVVGAVLFERGDPNLYDASHYRPETADHGVDIGAFEQDPYQYPPFLLVPFRALLLVSHNFTVIRALFFVLESVLLLLGMVLVARWIGDEQGFVALLLLPLVWVVPPNLIALQFGNIQGIVLVAAMLGMIAIDEDRMHLGAALLASAILAKIFPVILVIYLLARRRFKALAATALWGVFFSATVVVLGGMGPWMAFLTYQLPRLSSGGAFAELFASTPSAALLNLSYSSLPFKLNALGLIEAPQVSRLAALCGNLITLAAAIVLGLDDAKKELATAAAKEAGRYRIERILGWLALVNLSTLQSTMSPLYSLLGTFWILTLWAASRTHSKPASTAFLIVGASALLLVASPDADLLAIVLALEVQLANILINIAFVVRRWRAPPTGDAISGLRRNRIWA